ncbi:MAG: serine/threonine protein kinase, partial [Blastocatellia bacterium]|nr:serine/threonine protein kinase [Blastocatellia bacterium]
RQMDQGGLSTLFAATDLLSGQAVVIKISNPAQLARRDLSYTIDPQEARSYWSEMIERMRLEAEALVTIDHPNIVRFHGTGMINDDLRYVVMEYLCGRTLRDEISGRKRFELSEALRLGQEIISGLKEVHSRGIVHRDINPSNIFIESVDGQDKSAQTVTKLIDFGIAKFPQPPGAPPFTRYSVMSGTVAYASPEQCQNHPLDYRTDIYSLGIVLYEMLTGQRPFSGRTPTEIALNQIQTQPPSLRAINPYLPAGVERTILRALAKNPGERQQSIGELGRELRAAMSNQIIVPLKAETIVHKLNNESPYEKIDQKTSLEDSSDEDIKAGRRRRRRTFVVTASLLLLLAAGVLLGKHMIKLQLPVIGGINGAKPELAAAPTPEASPADLASDEDALETAAQLFKEGIREMSNLANPSPHPSATMAPAGEDTAAAPVGTPAAQTQEGNANDSAAGAADATAQTAANNGPPAPPKAQPQTPPIAVPPIVATHLLKPESEPEISQAPKNKVNEGGAQNGNSSPAPDNSDNPGVSERSDGGFEERNQGNPLSNHRRAQLRQPERPDNKSNNKGNN